MRSFFRFLLILNIFISAGFLFPPNPIDQILQRAIRNRAFPGASVSIGTTETVVKEEAYGGLSYRTPTPVSVHTSYDLASLTKVIATTTATMKLYEQGKLDLNAKVAAYLPEFGNNGKENITVYHLLTHTGGLHSFYPFYRMGISDRQGVVDFIMTCRPDRPAGEQMEYSDLDLILMQLIVERLSGKPLDVYLKEEFWMPLGMNDTGFRGTGLSAMDANIPPTENDTYFRNRLLQGEVHDETAWLMGGVAGHAGLFSSVSDLRKFAQFMLREGTTENGVQLLQPETIRYFTRAQNPTQHSRAIGWDTKSNSLNSSAGKHLSPQSYGHTGFTGTSIWIDPENQSFVILLTNRVHPSRANRKIAEVRIKVADAAYQLIKSSNTQTNQAPQANPRTWK